MIASDGAIARGDQTSSGRFVRPRTRHKSRRKRRRPLPPYWGAGEEGAGKPEFRRAGDAGDFGIIVYRVRRAFRRQLSLENLEVVFFSHNANATQEHRDDSGCHLRKKLQRKRRRHIQKKVGGPAGFAYFLMAPFLLLLTCCGTLKVS